MTVMKILAYGWVILFLTSLGVLLFMVGYNVQGSVWHGLATLVTPFIMCVLTIWALDTIGI